MGKIVFLDIDGTLRDFDGYIPQTAIKAIKRAREKGGHICLCTGRPMCQIESRVMDIGFDGVVSGSGSYVLYKGKRVAYKCFTLLSYIRFCEYLLEYDCIIDMQTYKDCYILKKDQTRFRDIVKNSEIQLGSKTKPILPKVLSSYMDITNVEKMLYFSDILSMDQIQNDWSRSFHIVPISVPGNKRWGGEITPLMVNKAEGINSILAVSKHSIEDTIAIGDSYNDIEMLEYAGIGVAMGNAPSEIKAAADLVTESLRDDGIQKAFQQLGLL